VYSQITLPSNRCDSDGNSTNGIDNKRQVGGFCAIAPQVPTVSISGSTNIARTGAVTLSFTAVADPEQEPVVQYIIDWGDGTTTKQTGLRLQSRPSPQNAITLVHVYSYADVVRNRPAACSGGSCTVTPRVQITDNWGWCNGNFEDADGPGGCTPDPANPLACRTGYYSGAGQCDLSRTQPWRIGPSIQVSER
jgi:hypothetical protein